MKRLFVRFMVSIIQALFSLRYKLIVKGLDEIQQKALHRRGGILFLPNHPTVFIDPTIVSCAVLHKFNVRPMVVEYFYYLPVVNTALQILGAVAVPDIDVGSNSYKKYRTMKAIKKIEEEVQHGENFLIYPAGRTKSTHYEAVGGASAVWTIVRNSPDANIVLVRVKGLWGSIFSRAFSGEAPPMMPNLLRGMKYILQNFIFFTPRREVILEFEDVTEQIPRNLPKLQFNRWLEHFYNKPDGLTKQEGNLPGDSLVLIPHTIWGDSVDTPWKPPSLISAGVNAKTVSKEVRRKVIAKIASLADIPEQKIRDTQDFSADLALDSLSVSELAMYIQDEFDIANLVGPEMKVVADALVIADKKVELKQTSTGISMTESKKWKKNPQVEQISLASGDTIIEKFLNKAKANKLYSACADDRSGVLSYKDALVRVLILAEVIKTMPGKYIGIMLPSSVAASLCILAAQLCGKIPLLINWTVGARHLDAVQRLSKVETVLTSWAFLDRLEHVDLTPIQDKFFMLEDLKPKISLFDKLRALLRSYFSTKTIMKTYGSCELKADSEAVLLFTSGTESLPKGVPLTHRNVLTNHYDAMDVVNLHTSDVFLAILPPFHAFGFTVSTLFPLLSGMSVYFHPNPTEGKRLAKICKDWDVSILCGAPTFLKAIFRGGSEENFKSITWCVTGAEKAPPELFETAKKLGIGDKLYEGYGITECSPVLTMNRPGIPQNGVGEPVKSVALKIVHPETYESLKQGETGLVLARGPNVFNGYLNPDIASPFVTLDEKRWYKTGDLGYLDERGKLVISGRQKRFIKVGGEMISLGGIETAILEAAPEKGWPIPEDGACVAVCAKEDPGKKPHIVLFTTFHTSVDEANRLLRAKGFSNLTKVNQIVELEEIPLMGTGKVFYRQLESQYLA